MTILVTGGGGFLGGAIVRRLLAQGATLRTYSRTTYPWLNELGVQQCTGDLAHAEEVRQAVAGCETVFHVAAKAGVWGKRSDYYKTNVLGTRNIIQACQAEGVKRLVYTSTPSVVHNGGDLEGVDETKPYATHFTAHYPESKVTAEQAILAANSPTLSTVALRPHLIWGPGDPHLIPRLLAKARAGKLRQFGKRNVRVDVTYVDNAALAHVLAWQTLCPQSVQAGKAYFISQGEPVDLWGFLNRILAIHQLPPVTRTVPIWLANCLARTLENLFWLLQIRAEPPLTRFVVEQMSTSHWYNIAAAQRDFGYQPEVGLEEGLQRLNPTPSLTSETRY